MANLKGFYRASEARKPAPVVSRPDLVTARNAVLQSAPVRGSGDLRPWERQPVRLSREPADNRVHFYRPDGTKYAILSPARFAEMRKAKMLESWLDDQRESGTIIAA